MATKKTGPRSFIKNVAPDRVDLRDRLYLPEVTAAPPPRLNTLKALKVLLPILDQKDTNACTGFALATIVNLLLHRAGRTADTPVSPFMVYSMARRYDEVPRRQRGHRLEPARRHERVVQARRLLPEALARREDASSG